MEWHYLPMTESQYLQAVQEIEQTCETPSARPWSKPSRRPDFVFLTGDLGSRLWSRCAMLWGHDSSMPVSPSKTWSRWRPDWRDRGLRPWIYSIAPFIYARPYEQVRNDVCLHRLPVVLVGNGGGYGYGVMGATHHASRIMASLLVTAPSACLHSRHSMQTSRSRSNHSVRVSHPAYLRLGPLEEPEDAAIPAYAPWRQAAGRAGLVVLVTGPLVGGIWECCPRSSTGTRRPTLWVFSELPLRPDPGCVSRPTSARSAGCSWSKSTSRKGAWCRISPPPCCRRVNSRSLRHGRRRVISRDGTVLRSSTVANAGSIPLRSFEFLITEDAEMPR